MIYPLNFEVKYLKFYKKNSQISQSLQPSGGVENKYQIQKKKWKNVAYLMAKRIYSAFVNFGINSIKL
jgi:hypothetical protein